MKSTQQPDACDPLATLRDVHTTLRSDLHVTRQLTNGEPIYVIYDPVSFQAHRLGLKDYRVTARLSESRPLADCFRLLQQDGILESENESEFYQFIAQLDALGLLTTSHQDSGVLYERFQAKQASKNKLRHANFLFITFPLANPDRFLHRTAGYFKFLFERWVLVPWLLAMAGAILLIANRWSDFIAPLNGLLAVKNLLFMSVAFAGLKVWHELGHGYACKKFGGRVPEMGCKLIVGMPLAYVDATSAWSFPKRSQRIVVMLGGMYFESLIAIPAVFVWAFAPTTAIGSCAYMLVFMAGVASLFFNANPLLRYDGYFILSDLLGIPNLRAKSQKEVANTLKYWVLKLPYRQHHSWRKRLIFLTYGISSSLYFLTMIVSISLVVAARFQIVGICFLLFNLGMLLIKRFRQLFHYLLKAKETETVRPRARLTACLLGVGVPVLLLAFPVPSGVQVPGVVTGQLSTTVRSDVAGTILAIFGEPGEELAEGQPIVQLQEIDTALASETDRIAALAARRNARFVSREDVTQATKLHFEADALWTKSVVTERQKSELTIKAPHAGHLATILPVYDVGKFVRVGDPIAKVVAGQTLIRAWLDEEQLASAMVDVGTSVCIRMADDSSSSCRGIITSLAPVKASEFIDLALTTEGEGTIVYDHRRQQPQHPIFQMIVAVDSRTTADTLDHARANLLLNRRYEPVAFWLLRHSRNFANRVFAT